MARRGLHLLDVDAGAEPAPLGGDYHHPGGGIVAGCAQRTGQVVPALHRDRVDWREVDHHLGDTAGRAKVNSHGRDSQT
jgi:hypothetical protein